MNDRIKEAVRKAKELALFCPNQEEKKQIEQNIKLIEMLGCLTEEDIKMYISKEEIERLEKAIAIIDAIYSTVAMN